MDSTSRRQFILLTLGAGSAVALGLARGWQGVACADTRTHGLSATKRTLNAFGTEMSVVALHNESAVAERGAEAVLAAVREVQAALSIYDPRSDLSRLNDAGRVADPHPLLPKSLRAARSMSMRTGGAFDVTVQPLWKLYSDSRKRGGLPDPDSVSETRELVGWRGVAAALGAVSLTRPGMAVTLNGLAQGLAADRALAALQAAGVQHALVNTGEFGSLGTRHDGSAWQAGIQHPREPDAYAAVMRLDGRFVATSGDYASSFTDDFTAHHIFDPATGRSPLELSSVTVAARTGLMADMLSTAVFVLGLAKGLELVARTGGADALCITRTGELHATAGFPAV